MSTEYVNRLKTFSDQIQGEFSHIRKAASAFKTSGWSRVEIKLPIPDRLASFIAYSGTNQSEVYSGFYGETKLDSKLSCIITQKDKVLSLLNTFNKLKVKSGRPSFDKHLSTICNDKQFVRKLTSDPEISRFLESNIKLPLRFEVISNYNGYIKSLSEETRLITINNNEWIVDGKKLTSLYEGFRTILDKIK